MGIGERRLIAIILFLGLILRLISLNQSLWLDEAINTLAVKNYSLFDLVAQYARADFHPPGWFIILWFWTLVFGYSEIAVRIPSVIFGSLTIWVTYLIGKKLVSRRVGLIAALLIAINPLHVYYSQEARMYAMATLAVAVNMLFFIKVIRQEKVNQLLYVLSNLFVLTSDYIAYFIFPTQMLFILLYKRAVFKKWLLVLVSATLLGSWWLPIFWNQLNVGSVASSNLPTWKFVAGSFDLKTLPLTFVKFIIGRISLADKALYAAILLPVGSLFAFSLLKGIKTLDNFARRLILFWMIIPLSLATIISFAVPVYNYFRVLYIIPAFVILVSAGILSLKSKLRYVFLTLVCLVEFFSTSIYLFNSKYQREDWRGLVNFLKSQDKNSLVLFESSGILPPFDYYAKGEINAKGALKDFPAKNSNDLMDFSQISNNIYLVEYLIDISDHSRLVQRKLGELGYKNVETKDFTGVGFVYHYVK